MLIIILGNYQLLTEIFGQQPSTYIQLVTIFQDLFISPYFRNFGSQILFLKMFYKKLYGDNRGHNSLIQKLKLQVYLIKKFNKLRFKKEPKRRPHHRLVPFLTTRDQDFLMVIVGLGPVSAVRLSRILREIPERSWKGQLYPPIKSSFHPQWTVRTTSNYLYHLFKTFRLNNLRLANLGSAQ